jgi:hypothetical protein
VSEIAAVSPALEVAKDVFERHGVDARQLPSASPTLLTLDGRTRCRPYPSRKTCSKSGRIEPV